MDSLVRVKKEHASRYPRCVNKRRRDAAHPIQSQLQMHQRSEQPLKSSGTPALPKVIPVPWRPLHPPLEDPMAIGVMAYTMGLNETRLREKGILRPYNARASIAFTAGLYYAAASKFNKSSTA